MSACHCQRQVRERSSPAATPESPPRQVANPAALPHQHIPSNQAMQQKSSEVCGLAHLVAQGLEDAQRRLRGLGQSTVHTAQLPQLSFVMPCGMLSFIWHLHLGVEVSEDEVGKGLKALVSNLLPAKAPAQKPFCTWSSSAHDSLHVWGLGLLDEAHAPDPKHPDWILGSSSCFDPPSWDVYGRPRASFTLSRSM